MIRSQLRKDLNSRGAYRRSFNWYSRLMRKGTAFELSLVWDAM